ncbi:tRNA uridine-5-carboxymethylaminomethyl(34) synthesis GTPase MnmE [Ruminococcus sp. HUN007]|uniref:tRNA uridine-5-carboxymethylaminomethyl(34) synthesis GTPase MnmE n=1 Tax=Ruminococcus sp. HUN007 TaxID=1514668 RepID=UPI0005D21699|nr:tRNA uridine-5-carboxymethylaminomethyl(34) synthesis GTPase MnmE [Ruminococcus sp. HUN007]
MSTVAAISTPNAVGGIAVIRISGEDAFAVSDRVFKAYSGKKVSEMEGYTCAYGEVSEKGEKLDDVVLTVFRAPKSYTGEDVAEISCHGGLFITRQILRLVLASGAELAEPGEFTKRAFLNGKMSLTQAEAVMDVISSTGKNELKFAVALKDGAMFRRITSVREKLVKILGDLAAWADYPEEEDIPFVEPDKLEADLVDIRSDLMKLSATYDYGKIIREGINTVIVGRPNVGKSTLMNCLSGYERSIVTNIAGTTRDVVEEYVKIGELTIRLSDTAGIRNTDDQIEQRGVEIAYGKIKEADLILAVFDSSEHLSDDDRKIIDSLKERNAIALLNKSDKERVADIEYLREHFKYVIEISAKTSGGIEGLEEVLEKMFINEEIDSNDGIIANERQKLCLEMSLDSVNEALAALKAGESLDAVTVVIDEALAALLKLTGEKVTDSVVDEVFSRFCVGK